MSQSSVSRRELLGTLCTCAGAGLLGVRSAWGQDKPPEPEPQLDIANLRYCTELYMPPPKPTQLLAGGTSGPDKPIAYDRAEPSPTILNLPENLIKQIPMYVPAQPNADKGGTLANTPAPPAAPKPTDDELAHYAGETLAALWKAKMWPKRYQVLRVAFLQNPGETVGRAIIRHARRWEPIIQRQFRFVDSGPAEIRITFAPTGSWSLLGTDAVSIPQNQASMNFGWFNNNTADEEFRRTTLHEFGHAVGLIHEHMHPAAGIPWNVQAVLWYYYRTQGWSPQQTYQQVLIPMNRTVLQMGNYDKTSIMHYPVPRELITRDDAVVGWNTDLSEYDKAFVSQAYSQLA
jgi:serralysin